VLSALGLVIVASGLFMVVGGVRLITLGRSWLFRAGWYRLLRRRRPHSGAETAGWASLNLPEQKKINACLA